ncbi:MAG: L,D-transpeptidase family protein [Planctomycetota bacterium]
MVMPSQSPRVGMSSRYMTTGRRKPKLRVPLILAAAAVVAVGIYLLWGSSDTPLDELAQTEASGGSLLAPLPPSNTPPNAGSSGYTPPISPEPTSTPRDSTPATTPEPASITLGSSTPPTTTPPTTPTRRVLPPAPAVAPPVTHTQGPAASQLKEGMQLIEERNFLAGRALLSELLLSRGGALTPHDASVVRDRLTILNEDLVFGKRILAGDPLTRRYTVQPGDRLGGRNGIARQAKIPYQAIEYINKIKASALPAGRSIKLVNGPFHARITKHAYRLDLFLVGPDGLPIYVRSFEVGLGEDDSTPLGMWRIKPGSKVQNPSWKNPRTGEFFSRDDPKNPIGEYWLALEGLDDNTRDISGYGIHGTIDQQSIGQQASMGCVRLRRADIALLYDLLSEGQSTVEIVP